MDNAIITHSNLGDSCLLQPFFSQKLRVFLRHPIYIIIYIYLYIYIIYIYIYIYIYILTCIIMKDFFNYSIQISTLETLLKLCLHDNSSSSSRSPFSRGKAGHLSFRWTATFGFIHCSLLLAFLSTFPRPLPFSDLSSDNPPFLAVVFLVFCSLIVSL